MCKSPAASPRLTTLRLSCAAGAPGTWAAALQLPGGAWATLPPPRRGAAWKQRRGWAPALRQAPRPAGLQGPPGPLPQIESGPGRAQSRSRRRQVQLLGPPVAALERCDRIPTGGGCWVVRMSSGWAEVSAAGTPATAATADRGS